MAKPSIYILLKILIYVKGMSCFGGVCQGSVNANNKGLKNYLQRHIDNPLLKLKPEMVEVLKKIKIESTNTNIIRSIETILSEYSSLNPTNLPKNSSPNPTILPNNSSPNTTAKIRENEDIPNELNELRKVYEDDYKIIQILNSIIRGNYNKQNKQDTRKILNKIWPFLSKEAKKQDAENANTQALKRRMEKLNPTGGMIRQKVYTRKNRRIRQRGITLKNKKHLPTT